MLARPSLGPFDVGQPQPRTQVLEVGAGGRLRAAQGGVQVTQGARLVLARPAVTVCGVLPRPG